MKVFDPDGVTHEFGNVNLPTALETLAETLSQEILNTSCFNIVSNDRDKERLVRLKACQLANIDVAIDLGILTRASDWTLALANALYLLLAPNKKWSLGHDLSDVRDLAKELKDSDGINSFTKVEKLSMGLAEVLQELKRPVALLAFPYASGPCEYKEGKRKWATELLDLFVSQFSDLPNSVCLLTTRNPLPKEIIDRHKICMFSVRAPRLTDGRILELVNESEIQKKAELGSDLSRLREVAGNCEEQLKLLLLSSHGQAHESYGSLLTKFIESKRQNIKKSDYTPAKHLLFALIAWSETHTGEIEVDCNSIRKIWLAITSPLSDSVPYDKSVRQFREAIEVLVEMGIAIRTAHDDFVVPSLWLQKLKETDVLPRTGNLRLASVRNKTVEASLQMIGDIDKFEINKPAKIDLLEVVATCLKNNGYLDQLFAFFRKLGRRKCFDWHNYRQMYHYLEIINLKTTTEKPSSEDVSFVQADASQDRAWCRRQRARFLIDDGEWEKAIKINTEILNHASFSGTRTFSRTLGDLGFAHYMLGNFRSSESYLEDAISTTQNLIAKSQDLKTNSDFSSDLSRYFRHIALLHQKREDNLKAFEAHGKALSFAQTTHERGIVLSNRSRMLGASGKRDASIDDAETALKLANDMNDIFLKMGALRTLGNRYGQFGDYAKMINYCSKSLEMAQKYRFKGEECNQLDSLGDANFGLGNIDEAISFHKKGQKIAVARAHIAYHERGIARYHLARKEFESAELQFLKAITTRSETLEPQVFIKSNGKTEIPRRENYLKLVIECRESYRDFVWLAKTLLFSRQVKSKVLRDLIHTVGLKSDVIAVQHESKMLLCLSLAYLSTERDKNSVLFARWSESLSLWQIKLIGQRSHSIPFELSRLLAASIREALTVQNRDEAISFCEKELIPSLESINECSVAYGDHQNSFRELEYASGYFPENAAIILDAWKTLKRAK